MIIDYFVHRVHPLTCEDPVEDPIGAMGQSGYSGQRGAVGQSNVAHRGSKVILDLDPLRAEGGRYTHNYDIISNYLFTLNIIYLFTKLSPINYYVIYYLFPVRKHISEVM